MEMAGALGGRGEMTALRWATLTLALAPAKRASMLDHAHRTLLFLLSTVRRKDESHLALNPRETGG